jgi:hypothetical protein
VEDRVDSHSVVLAAVVGDVHHTEDEKDAIAVKDAENGWNATEGYAALALLVVFHAQGSSETLILVLHLQIAYVPRSVDVRHS